jgi:hypothetical protein
MPSFCIDDRHRIKTEALFRAGHPVFLYAYRRVTRHYPWRRNLKGRGKQLVQTEQSGPHYIRIGYNRL